MRATGDDLHKKIAEGLSDLAHHITLAHESHQRRTGSSSIPLMCASRLACELRDNFIKGVSDAEGEPPTAPEEDGEVVGHARMPVPRKIR